MRAIAIAAVIAVAACAVTPASATPEILDSYGLRPLSLGMTCSQALATTLLVDVEQTDGTCQGLIKGSERAHVYISRARGVEIIEAFGGIRTPAGIHLGSSSADVHRAYPAWHGIDDTPDGPGYAPAPGNSRAHYRIVTRGGTVAELSLTLIDQNFYE